MHGCAPPGGLDAERVLDLFRPDKDVDGLAESSGLWRIPGMRRA